MKRIIKLMAIVCLGIISLKATCGKPKMTIIPTPEITIEDDVYFHNMSITFDGNHYYTLNGGNSEYGKINEYDMDGEYIESYSLTIDGRAIFYRPDDENLYAKISGYDLNLVDLSYEDTYAEKSDIFTNDNSSPAMSPDGSLLYEMENGVVRVINFDDGDVIKSFILNKYYDEHGYNSSVAVTSKYLLAWGSPSQILVYDLDGKYVTKIDLPQEGFGFSLSFCNGLLWIAQDADGSTDGATGYWYGYRVEGLE
jgi:WD40 repeat protein